jgi:hypothetical protein
LRSIQRVSIDENGPAIDVRTGQGVRAGHARRMKFSA